VQIYSSLFITVQTLWNIRAKLLSGISIICENLSIFCFRWSVSTELNLTFLTKK